MATANSDSNSGLPSVILRPELLLVEHQKNYLHQKPTEIVVCISADSNNNNLDTVEDNNNNQNKPEKMPPNAPLSTSTTILETIDEPRSPSVEETVADANHSTVNNINVISGDIVSNGGQVVSAAAAGCKAHKLRHRHSVDQMTFSKLVEKANNVEHAMMNMFHNAWNVCHFHHLPQWLQDNDYLLFGHRPPMASFKACFWSIFRLHTETMNIWTHGLGCICFVIFSIYLFVGSSYATIPFIDKLMLGIFLTTAILCLAFSTCYHTLACHSHQVLIFVCKLDYCGISLLIAGSIVPCLYYAFYCSLSAQLFYSFLTIALCAASVTVSFAEKFSEAQYRPLRASVFTAYAFSSFIPAVHWFWVHPEENILHGHFRTAIICLALMAVLYMTGALVYALRIPECFYPGKFDFYFHSHQLFHIFVILAAICHLRGITSMADVRLFAQQTCQIH